MPAKAARGLLCAGLVSALGCQVLNEPIYIPAPAALEPNFIAAKGAPANPATVKGSVVLRFRRPTAAEQKQLDDQSTALTFQVPWLKRDKLHLELLYTVTNVSNTPLNGPPRDGTFSIAVDGASELAKYDEDAVAQAFAAANEKPVRLPLIAPTPRMLGPGQMFQGTVREDDFIEGSLDLDAMGRWMAPFAAVLINRSDVNPVGLDMVPKNVVIPALQEIDVTADADVPIHCEFMVRVRDDDDQLLRESSDANLFVPTPTVFQPPPPPPP